VTVPEVLAKAYWFNGLSSKGMSGWLGDAPDVGAVGIVLPWRAEQGNVLSLCCLVGESLQGPFCFCSGMQKVIWFGGAACNVI
jgi:hypothetical protein